MKFDLGGQIKSSMEDSLHRAKMAWKAGKSEEAAAHFESASELMFKFAEYANNRDQEYDRKKKAIEYRDYARRLRETAAEDARKPRPPRSGPVGGPDGPGKPQAAKDYSDPANQEESAPEITSAVAQMVQTSPLTWADIGGLSETKDDIKYTLGLSLAKAPEGLNLHTFRNILFYGPPGTGKTILAAATSNALKKSTDNSITAMFFNVKVSGVMSKYFGESSKIISEIYGTARDNSPSVIFLDEFESLSGKRGSDEQSGAEKRILSTILSELDGLTEKGRERDVFVLTVAATNRPWDIDSAVLSRFEKRILIPLPDPETRKAILDILFTKRGFETSANMSDVVEMTEGFSGREIERLCKEVTTRMIRMENRTLPGIVDSGLEKAREHTVSVRAITADEWQAAAKATSPATSPAEMQNYLDWNDSADW